MFLRKCARALCKCFAQVALRKHARVRVRPFLECFDGFCTYRITSRPHSSASTKIENAGGSQKAANTETTVFAHRSRRSPQRAETRTQRSCNSPQLLHIDRADPRRGPRAQIQSSRIPHRPHEGRTRTSTNIKICTLTALTEGVIFSQRARSDRAKNQTQKPNC